MSVISFFTSQPDSRNSTASQSSSSGCDGGRACTPKSSADSTNPAPKNSCQKRFTMTRANRGLVAIDHPARQPEPVRGQPRGHRRQERRRGGLDHLARLIVHAAKQERRRRLRIGPLFDHHRGVRPQLDLAMLGADAREVCRQFPVGGIAIGEVIALQRLFFDGRPCGGGLRRGHGRGRPRGGHPRFFFCNDAIEDAEFGERSVKTPFAGRSRPKRHRLRVSDAALQLGRNRRILIAVGATLDGHPGAVQVERVAVLDLLPS